MIRYISQYEAHDTIRITIHFSIKSNKHIITESKEKLDILSLISDLMAFKRVLTSYMVMGI